MWLFGGTEAERKKEEYYKLWRHLTTALDKHTNMMNQVNKAAGSYKGTIPFLSSSQIPSDDFEPKRAEKTREMDKYVDYEDSKTKDLTTAKNIAHEKYQHYKKIAEEEARERREAFMDSIASFFGGGK